MAFSGKIAAACPQDVCDGDLIHFFSSRAALLARHYRVSLRHVAHHHGLANCSAISRCSRLMAFSGRTITLKCVIRSLASQVMISTPLMVIPSTSPVNSSTAPVSLVHSPTKRKLGPFRILTTLVRYLNVTSRPRCGVCTTGLSNTTSGSSKSQSKEGSWDVVNSRQRCGPIVPINETSHGQPPRCRPRLSSRQSL